MLKSKLIVSWLKYLERIQETSLKYLTLDLKK